ncbi:MAG: ZIP family metal transporter [Candidatus Altiarchaeota archaeon]|nr:ZIP family metal transporter [Candidatus Altiarchaeota archaeon]
MSSFWLMIFLIFAGQTLGSFLGLIKKPNKHLLRSSLAFAAAMMIGISIINLIPEALMFATVPVVALFFLSGILILRIVDWILPHIHPELFSKESDSMKKNLMMLSLGMALHNIPEGLVIGIGFAVNPTLGLAIALSMTVQDIPENIALVIPLYCYLKDRMKSFMIVAGTILFQVAGFLFGFFILKDADPIVLGSSLAIAGGFMTYIAIEELLPAAKIKENPKSGIISFILGIFAVLVITGLSMLTTP